PKPAPDAGHTKPPAPDAAVPADAGSDAATPPSKDDWGMCADRDANCALGHGETLVGSATCMISGDLLWVDRMICEVCNQSTELVDFSLAIMDCGGCAQVYRESSSPMDTPLAPGACVGYSDAAGLTWTAADPHCVDVYAYVGSGVS